VPKVGAGPPAARSDLPAPFFARFDAFESPVTGQPVTSERQRQRDMQQANAFDPRDLPRGHQFSRGRDVQLREAQSGDRDRSEAGNTI